MVAVAAAPVAAAVGRHLEVDRATRPRVRATTHVTAGRHGKPRRTANATAVAPVQVAVVAALPVVVAAVVVLATAARG